jgi:hypothetical protein
MVLTRVFLQELHEPSFSKVLAKASKGVESSQETPPPIEIISESPDVMEIHLDWCTPFMIYHRIGGLLEDMDEHEQLCRWAVPYTLLNDELFWQSVNDILMKCVTPNKGFAILQDIHAEICSSHADARSLVGKTYRQGFYWPTTVSDADSLVRCYKGCQFFTR